MLTCVNFAKKIKIIQKSNFSGSEIEWTNVFTNPRIL